LYPTTFLLGQELNSCGATRLGVLPPTHAYKHMLAFDYGKPLPSYLLGIVRKRTAFWFALRRPFFAVPVSRSHCPRLSETFCSEYYSPSTVSQAIVQHKTKLVKG